MLDARLQEVYRIRRDQTKQFLYTVANQLYRDYDAVGIGDYVPHSAGITRTMRRAMNTQSLPSAFQAGAGLFGAALRQTLPPMGGRRFHAHLP